MSKISMARPQGPLGMSQPFGILRLPLTTLFSMHKAGGLRVATDMHLYNLHRCHIRCCTVLYIYIYYIISYVMNHCRHTYIHTYIPTYVRTYVRTYIYIYIQCVCGCVMWCFMYRNIDVFNMFFSRTWLPSSPSRRSFRTPGRPKRSLDSHGSVGISAMTIR